MKQLKELDPAVAGLDAAGRAAGFDFFFQWHLTEKCNLRCKHCYQDGSVKKDLSLREIKATIAEISETLDSWAQAGGMLFAPSFNISGGEPLVRRDLMKVLEELAGRSWPVYLLTNGTLASPERAKAIGELGNVKGVQVSVEGPENVHDMIRGRGSLAQALWGARNLLDAGLVVTLNATLSDLNAEYIDDMVSLALSIGVQRLGFARLVPSGRGAALHNHMLSPERMKSMYEKLMSMKIDGLEIVTGDPIASQMKFSADAGCCLPGGCSAGLFGLTIQADGTVTPCRRLPVPLGNIREDSIREIWANSPVLEALRDKSRYNGRCAACSKWDSCRGCRAVAYAWSAMSGSGDFLSEDPQCFLETGEDKTQKPESAIPARG
ncbi:MAG: radical SAM protein [Nitrospiraceae bacterium]|nr:radical SAM protein [Nitrospiraceae bacterium]